MNPHKKHLLLLLLLVSSLVCTHCSPTTDEPAPTPVKQSDQAGSAAVDASIDDINDIISNKIGGGSEKAGRVAAYNLPCGIVSIDSSQTQNGKKVYAVSYGKETPCGYKKKGGTVAFQLVSGTRFADEDAVYTITFTNYTVEIVATGNVVTVNGTLYVTNVNGGYIWAAVVNNATIQHRVRGSYTVTYANGQSRTRKYYQLRTWSSTNQWAGLTFTVAGDTTISSVKVVETGKTLEGNYDYQMQVLTDFQWSNCGTTYAGPYVLKKGLARMNVSVPAIPTAYIQVEAGYTSASGSDPVKKEDCSSNAYKIDVVIGPTTTTQYQLY